MSRPIALLVIVSLLGMLPVATAQGHDHGGGAGDGVLLMADLPADGRAVVGGISHFAYVILDEEGAPQPHNDVHVAVTLNGATLYATESAHDYDGAGGFDIVFPTTGTYNVTVTVPADPPRIAHYQGYVVATEPAAARLVLDAPATVAAGTPTTFTYHITDAAGTLLGHTDANVEIRRVADDFPVLRVHTHTHDAPMSFDYAFEKSGTYLVTIVGYVAFPDEEAPAFDPIVKTHLVDVEGEALPTAATIPPGVIPVDVATEAAAEGGPRTETALDPASGTSFRVGPFSQVRASIVTYDPATMRLVQHLDHHAMLIGPYGLVFSSKSLHEYDGVLELMSANQMIGDYTWTVTVDGARETEHTLSYEVAPANAPAFSAGPQFLKVSGLDRLGAGRPGTVDLFVHGAGEVPFQHGELGVKVSAADGVPLLEHKLHTHASGTFAFELTPPETGEYVLQVDPFDVHGAPTPTYHGRTLGAARSLGFTVTGGEALVPGAPFGPTDETVDEDVPGIGPQMMLILLVALATIAARRGPLSR